MRNETGIDILASELKGEKYDEACKRVFDYSARSEHAPNRVRRMVIFV